jgi:hypothetical protein
MLDAAVAPASSVLALDTAGRLDRELAAVETYLGDTPEWFVRDARSALLVRSIKAVVVTARLLRQHVLDAICRSTDGTIDILERGIRARANIVMRALYVLGHRECEVPASALVAPFGHVRDVCAFLVDRVTAIYARWSDQRATDHELDPSTRQALRYIAVDEAEVAFERLGRDAALATFLQVGAASDSPAVSTACRELAAIVGLMGTTQNREHASDTPGPDEECAS